MLLEAIAAALVGLLLVALVIQPVLFPSVPSTGRIEPLDPEETPRGQALLALKEIEFDRATGKLSEADFVLLNARYSAAAIAALDADAAPLRCFEHGPRREPAARFCAECGAGLVSPDQRCVTCGQLVPIDARFCAGCGLTLRP